MNPARSANLAPHIDLPAFNGPFDLLLHLIERETLDITAISLAQVTEQYLDQMRHLQEGRVERLVDFVAVAARLVLIKSRALLPKTPATPAGEEEEDPADALIRQLRRYKRFKEAATWLAIRQDDGLRTYLRVAPPPRPPQESKLDLSGVSAQTILLALQALLARSESLVDSVSVIRPRRVTIEDQLRRLRHVISQHGNIGFRELLSRQADRVEVAVTLLAMLELIKRREITVRQSSLFGPIELLAADATELSPPQPDTPPLDQ